MIVSAACVTPPGTNKGSQKRVCVHVFEGGEQCVQTAPLEIALEKLRKDLLYSDSGIVLDVKYKRRKCVREDATFDERKFVQWLNESDVHIIATHPCQANTHFWNVPEMSIALEALKSHVGFPHGEYLECPVFTQHKFKYLNLLPKFMVTPTYCVNLADHVDESAFDGVQQFLS